MINKKDIEKRLQRNPEPLEVKATRDIITEEFSKLKFIEESHQYFVEDREYPPVSTVCHRFEPYVDWDEIARKKAKKLKMPVEELQEEWHRNNITSTSCGSKTHYFGEQMMNLFIGRDVNLPFQYTSDGYMIPYCGKEKAVEKYWTDILGNDNIYPVMPEAKLFNSNLDYAGTFDILHAYRMNGELVYGIHDYKGLPLDTPILTEFGWKTFEFLEKGDKVYDGKHELTTILGLSEVHYNPCYRLVFNDFSIIADHEHRWLVWSEDSFIVLTTFDIKVFLGLGRKLFIERYTSDGFIKIPILCIESVSTVPTRCIEVESPEHTYLVGKEMIVTHNTNKSLINDFNRDNRKFLLSPFDDFIDEPLSIYSIQLSLYQLGLEQLGMKIVDRRLIWLKEDGTYEKIMTPDLTKRLLTVLGNGNKF